MKKNEPAYGTAAHMLNYGVNTFLLTELWHGLAICAHAFFQPKFTINYPFEKGQISPRYSFSLFIFDNLQLLNSIIIYL